MVSFGRLDVTSIIFVTDGSSEVTGVADALPSGIIQLVLFRLHSKISGALTTSGFEITQDSVHGTGNVISHSAQPIFTGSVTCII